MDWFLFWEINWWLYIEGLLKIKVLLYNLYLFIFWIVLIKKGLNSKIFMIFRI